MPVEVARWDLHKTVGEYIDPRLSTWIRDAKNPECVSPNISRDIKLAGAAAERLKGLEHYNKGIEPIGALLWEIGAVYEQYWEREDPPTQVAPGGEVTRSVSLRVGLTKERAREVTKSLGLSGGRANLTLSSQLASKTATKITVATEEVETRGITLRNPDANDRYRLFALWHLISRLSVIGIDFHENGSNFILDSTDFIPSHIIVQTWIDVGPSRE
jgi:hypothetical protein